MKKLFACMLTIALMAVTAVPALATDARLRALGSVGNYIEDDYNIFSWYGTLPSYSNMVWIGLTQDDYSRNWIGGSYAFGEDGSKGTLALFFHRNTRGPLALDGPETPWYDAIYDCPFTINDLDIIWGDIGDGWDGMELFHDALFNKFHVMYSYAMEGLSFGIHFSRADQHYLDEYSETADPDADYENEYKLAYTSFGAGVRFDVGEEMYADVAFDLTMTSQTGYLDNFDCVEDGFGVIEQDANMMYGFRGRLFHDWVADDISVVLPYFAFNMFDFSLKADSTDFNDDHWGNKGMMFELGIGANVAVNEDNMLVFAIEPFTYAKMEPSEISGLDTDEDYTIDAKMLGMPTFRLALESDVRDWLTFRAGGVKSLYKVTWKREYTTGGETWTQEYNETVAPFDLFLGLGFHVGDFDIDAVVHEETPFSLGYWLTGYDHEWEGPPVYMVTAKYSF